MGFGSVVSSIITFIAVVGVTTAVVIMLRDYTSISGSAIMSQRDVLSSQIKAEIAIDVIDYDYDTNTTTVYVRNSGKVVLDVDTVDVFIDSARIYRNTDNRTITLLNDTMVNGNIGWDPRESIQIDIFLNLTNETHSLRVSSEYGVSDTETFSLG